MFVEYSASVQLGLGEAQRRIDQARSEMGDWADVAYRHGEELRSRVGPSGPVDKAVILEVGIPEIQRRGLVYPISWAAVGADAVFPQLRADLVLTNEGMDRTRLTLRGTYDPPLGAVGRILDRALLGRVAEATVRNWVDRLAESLTSS